VSGRWENEELEMRNFIYVYSEHAYVKSR
jgi:hypothetical protein